MEKTKEDILTIVRPYIEKSVVEGITFSMDDYFERTPYAWKIGVRPSRYPRHTYILYDELAALSTDIAEREGLNVFFAVGEEQEAESEELAQAA